MWTAKLTMAVVLRSSTLMLVVIIVCSLLMTTAQGVIMCECLSQECQDEGTTMCYATHYCYSENVRGVVSKGCIDDSSPLLCENRKPQGKGIDYWPALYCCNDKDYCNKEVDPTLPSPSDDVLAKEAAEAEQPSPSIDDTEDQDIVQEEGGRGGGGGGRYRGRVDPYDPQYPVPPCQNADDGSAQRSNTNGGSSGGSKVINPIYIAVPVAGVCVLLALVIFAMYLLRRRHHHHHYDQYHHYHDHLHHPHHHAHHPPPPGGHNHLKHPAVAASSGPAGQMLGGVGGPGGGGSSEVSAPLYQHHLHCDCICKKALPPCGGKVNRCTDSERSSSGSETKLFLQA